MVRTRVPVGNNCVSVPPAMGMGTRVRTGSQPDPHQQLRYIQFVHSTLVHPYTKHQLIESEHTSEVAIRVT